MHEFMYNEGGTWIHRNVADSVTLPTRCRASTVFQAVCTDSPLRGWEVCSRCTSEQGSGCKLAGSGCHVRGTHLCCAGGALERANAVAAGVAVCFKVIQDEVRKGRFAVPAFLLVAWTASSLDPPIPVPHRSESCVRVAADPVSDKMEHRL